MKHHSWLQHMMNWSADLMFKFRHSWAAEIEANAIVQYIDILGLLSSSIVVIPVACLLWNFRTASGLAHDDTVHAEHRDRCLCRELDCP